MTLQTYLILFLMWISHFLVDMMFGVFAVYKTMAGLDLAIAGFIAGFCAFIGEGLQAIFGSLSDRGNRRILLFFGIAATASNVFLSYTLSYPMIFLVFLVVCIGSGAFHPSAAGLIGSLSDSKKGIFIGLFASGGALGLATSQLIFSNFYSVMEGNTVYMAIPTLVIVSSILLIKPAVKENESTIVVKDRGWKRYFALFNNRDFSFLYFTQICAQSVFWSIVFLLPDILLTRGYSHSIAFGGGHLCYITGGALTMIPAGYLADRYSCKMVMISGMVLGIILIYTFVFTPIIPNFLLFPLLFSMGAVIGTINPIGLALGNRLYPMHPGLVSACMMGMVWCIAEGLGQAGGGLLTKLFVVDAAAKALGLVSMLLFIGLGLAIRLPSVEKAVETAPI